MKRCVLVLLIFAMLLGMSTVSFAESRVILALGDSISAGYGLNDREADCFVSIMALESDIVINKAVDGNEATDIIDQLTNAENENYVSEDVIKAADIVTITCGGNDMMALLYEKIAAEYPNVHPRKKNITADEVLGRLADSDLYAIVAALNVLDKDEDVYYMNDGDFDIRLDGFMENLLWIAEYIHTINPEAEIVVATQYNPYVEFEDATGYDVLYFGMEEGATKLNDAIINNAENGDYTVADVKSAFDEFTGDEDLYNANPDIDNINLDFHPTQAGHGLIASVFGEIINIHRLGEINSDGTYSLPKDVIGYYITDADGETRFVDAGVYAAKKGDVVDTVYINIAMVDGAQVRLGEIDFDGRITEGNGLRFVARVDRSGFDADAYGMRITCEGSSEEAFVDATFWQNDTCFTVAIEDMPVENYTRNYTATPFVRVRYDDGTEKAILGTQSVTRSIYTVAKGLLESGEVYDEIVQDVLNAYVNMVKEN